MTENQLNIPFEEWKEIPGWEGYEASTHGRIRSYRRTGTGDKIAEHPKILRQNLHYNGYLAVALCDGSKRRTIKVHRLILETFVGSCPPGMECCHEDDIKSRNYLSNLRWGTPKSNADDRDNHGKTVKGEKHYKAKLTESDVIKIRMMYSEGHSLTQLGKMFYVTKQLIASIVKRKCWKHI